MAERVPALESLEVDLLDKILCFFGISAEAFGEAEELAAVLLDEAFDRLLGVLVVRV